MDTVKIMPRREREGNMVIQPGGMDTDRNMLRGRHSDTARSGKRRRRNVKAGKHVERGTVG